MSGEEDKGNLNIYGKMSNIGLGPGSPNNWEDYPTLPPLMQAALNAIITPSAYKALHFHPDSFAQVYGLRNMRVKDVMIFKIHEPTTAADVPAPTEHEELTVVKTDASAVLLPQPSRHELSAYRAIIGTAITVIGRNHRAAIHCRNTGRTQDIDALLNMAFAFAIEQEDDPSRLTAKGFYPYFSLNHEALNESVFFFFHEHLNRVIMVASATRAHALNFILKHGRRHAFDKTCAFCGKTGDLRKCSCCKMVRYCSKGCQDEHWARHKVECKRHGM